MTNGKKPMSKLLQIILVFIISFFSLHKVVAKTPADATIYSIGLAFNIFNNQHGEMLPGSWDECIQRGLLNEPLLSDGRRFCDLENLYFFPGNIKISDGRGGSIRIIVMAKAAGGEGDSNATTEDRIPGRYIIGEFDSGRVRAGRFREERLRKLFADANLDLSDYTFSSPEQRIIAAPRAEKPLPYPKVDEKNTAIRNDKSEVVPSNIESKSSIIPWLLVGLSLLAVIAWLMFRLIRRKRKGKDL